MQMIFFPSVRIQFSKNVTIYHNNKRKKSHIIYCISLWLYKMTNYESSYYLHESQKQEIREQWVLALCKNDPGSIHGNPRWWPEPHEEWSQAESQVESKNPAKTKRKVHASLIWEKKKKRLRFILSGKNVKIFSHDN